MKRNLLRYALLIFVTTICFAKQGKAQEVQFQYDAAGNQTVRNWVCIGCTTFPVALASQYNGTETATIPDAKKNIALTPRTIIAYPNPLDEVLHVKWEVYDKFYITKMLVSNAVGTTFFSQEFTYSEPMTQETTIPFQKQVPGLYILKAIYSDGKQEIIKVIKK